MSVSNYVIDVIDAYSTNHLSKAEQSFSAFVRRVCETFSSTFTTTERAQRQLQKAKWTHRKLQELVGHINRDNDGRLVELEVGGEPLTLRAESLDGRDKFIGLMYQVTFGNNDSVRILNDIYRRDEATAPKPWSIVSQDPPVVPQILFLSNSQFNVYDFATDKWHFARQLQHSHVISVCSDRTGTLIVTATRENNKTSLWEYSAGRWREIVELSFTRKFDSDIYTAVSSETIILVMNQSFFTIDRKNYKCERREWPSLSYSSVRRFGKTFFARQTFDETYFGQHGRQLFIMDPETFEWKTLPYTMEFVHSFYANGGQYIYAHSICNNESTLHILDGGIWVELPHRELQLLGLLVVDSKDCLWVIGGYDTNNKWNRHIWVFSLNLNQWQSIDFPREKNPYTDDQRTTVECTRCLTYTNREGEEEDVLYILEIVDADMDTDPVILHTYFIQREIWLQSKRWHDLFGTMYASL